MLIRDLIDTLMNRNPDAQVFLMTQRKQPFENHLAGIVAREDMADQNGRDEAGIAQDDVFLVVGKRIRPGSLSAWILSEQRSDSTQTPLVTETATDPAGTWHATLAAIAQQHLQIETLDERGADWLDVQDVRVRDVRAALVATYRAGIAAGLRHLRVETTESRADALTTGQPPISMSTQDD